ncbi:ribonuclease P protein subunit p25-like protein [Schistocerca gregaria]|uniref:ribonuclease P protein subunit p25-like protein n=1 Tax=Schistocerca gregaria TaxID=7010 RepID=UPI00211F22F7|nr:ribonuclease P protein subunit p25-like protein [Schistocerca gregaria]
MERYRRVSKPKNQDVKENEVLIGVIKNPKSYWQYAVGLLENKEKEYNEITLKAMGGAIFKAIMTSQMIKHTIYGLHQIITISEAEIRDEYAPIVEGLEPYETTRCVSSISVRLSKIPLDPTACGYQAPLTQEEMDQAKTREPPYVNSSTKRRTGGRHHHRGARRNGPSGGAKQSGESGKSFSSNSEKGGRNNPRRRSGWTEDKKRAESQTPKNGRREVLEASDAEKSTEETQEQNSPPVENN